MGGHTLARWPGRRAPRMTQKKGVKDDIEKKRPAMPGMSRQAGPLWLSTATEDSSAYWDASPAYTY